MNNLTNYVDFSTYYQDLNIIDEKLSNLEHNVEQITKNLVELLSTKATNYKEEKECGQD